MSSVVHRSRGVLTAVATILLALAGPTVAVPPAQAAESGAPTVSISMYSVGGTTVEVNYSFAPPGNEAGNATKLTVTANGLSTACTGYWTAAQTGRCLIRGLARGTRYALVGVAETEGGVSASSEPISVLTIPAPPSAPTNLTASAVTSTSITLSWDAPTDLGGPDVGMDQLTGWKIDREGGGTLATGDWSTSGTVKGLLPDTDYTLSVSANSRSGFGDKATGTFRTAPPTPPSAVTDLVAVAGKTSLALTWTSPSDTGTFPLTGYQIIVNGGIPQTVAVGTSATIPGLRMNTSYTVAVAALNMVGPGPAATVVARTTNDIPTPPGPTPNGGGSYGGDTRTVTTNLPARAPANDDGSPNLDGNPATAQQTTRAKWRATTLISGKPATLGAAKTWRTSAGQPIRLSIDGKSAGVSTARVVKTKAGEWVIVATIKSDVAKAQAVRVLASAPAVTGYEALVSERTYKVVHRKGTTARR